MCKEKNCMTCVWRNSQPNDNKLVFCRFHGIGVYAFGVPCCHYEFYDPENAAF